MKRCPCPSPSLALDCQMAWPGLTRTIPPSSSSSSASSSSSSSPPCPKWRIESTKQEEEKPLKSMGQANCSLSEFDDGSDWKDPIIITTTTHDKPSWSTLLPEIVHLILDHIIESSSVSQGAHRTSINSAAPLGRPRSNSRKRRAWCESFDNLVTLSRINRHWRSICSASLLQRPYLPTIERLLAFLADRERSSAQDDTCTDLNDLNSPSHIPFMKGRVKFLDLSGIKLTQPIVLANLSTEPEDLNTPPQRRGGVDGALTVSSSPSSSQSLLATSDSSVYTLADDESPPQLVLRKSLGPPVSPSALVLRQLPIILPHVTHLSIWLDCQSYATLLRLLEVPQTLTALTIKGNVSNGAGGQILSLATAGGFARAREACLRNAFAKTISRLTHISIDVGFEGDPARLKFTDFVAAHLGEVLRGLRMTGMTDRTAARVAQACPNVERFVNPWSSISEGAVMSYLTKWASLTALDLRGCQAAVTGPAMLALCRSCRHLTSLDLSFTQGGDAVLDALTRHATSLQALILAGCAELSEAGLTRLLSRRGHQFSVLSLAWLGDGVITPSLLDSISRWAVHLQRLDIRGSLCVDSSTVNTLIQRCALLSVLRMDTGQVPGDRELTEANAQWAVWSVDGDVKGTLFDL